MAGKRDPKDSLLIQCFQGSPRHIWYDGSASIYQSDICRLHERVDTDNFKNAFVLNASHALAVIGGMSFGSGAVFSSN
jgi:hypothetical protein